jgi:hypothetical protein
MGEQSSYRRTQLNFQPAETIGDKSVESDTNAGFRILSSRGKFRLYSPDGDLLGIYDSAGQAKLKAEKTYATQARLLTENDQLQYPTRDEVGQTAEASGSNRALDRTQGGPEGGQALGQVRQEGDVRFMPDVDPDLIALHNTSEEGIRASIKLGGIPVPSLGITKKDIAFTGFGDITLIADKATIDPMADPRNRLYSSDVYSPRQPRPFQSMVRGGRDIISKKIKALLPSGFESWSEIAPGERAYDKVVEKGDDNVAKTHRNMIGSPDVQAAFLTENGIQVPRLMKEPDIFNRVLSREQLSDSRLNELSKNSSNLYDFLQTKEGIEVGDEIRKMYIENSSSNYQNVSPERLMRMNVLIEESYGAPGTPFPFRDANSIVDDIRTVLKGGKKVDSFGIREWVRQEIKPREAEFAKWVDNLVSNVFEPNQKIIKGSKKLPYTLENLTEAMSGKVKAQEGGLTYSLGKARSESAVQFRSLEQAREAKGSIVGSVEMESFKKAQQDQFNRLVDMLTPFDKYQSRNSFDRLDDLSAAIGKIAKRPSSAESVLASIDFTGVPADVLSDVKRFATSLKSAPTEYFEAKPQRAVGLDEFKAAIVPESTSQDVIDALRNSGLYVEKYTDNAKRIAIVERVSGERNLRFMPAPVPDPSIPGAYSMSGYRILPGKTKSKFRVYSPDGSLAGVVGSVDDAQRMIQRKLQ